MNWMVVVGGLMFFLGAIVYVVSNAVYLNSLETDSFDTYRTAINLDSLAFFLFGLGLLVAFAGLAMRRT